MIACYCLLGTVGHIYDHRSYHRNEIINIINPRQYVTQALTALSRGVLFSVYLGGALVHYIYKSSL